MRQYFFSETYAFKMLLFHWKHRTLRFHGKEYLHLNMVTDFLGRNSQPVWKKKCSTNSSHGSWQDIISSQQVGRWPRRQSIPGRKANESGRCEWLNTIKRRQSHLEIRTARGDTRPPQAANSGETYFSFIKIWRGRWKWQQNGEKVLDGEGHASMIVKKMMQVTLPFW